jgi:hypothetical protein
MKDRKPSPVRSCPVCRVAMVRVDTGWHCPACGSAIVNRPSAPACEQTKDLVRKAARS